MQNSPYDFILTRGEKWAGFLCTHEHLLYHPGRRQFLSVGVEKMIKANSLAYYGRDKGSYRPQRAAHNFRKRKNRVALLWGDPVYVINIQSGTAEVSAKGHHISIPVEHLMEEPLLCIYQIDCGQGDSALVNFPDGRWMMVDAGPFRDWSNSGKIAPDFLYWKMFVDQSWKYEFDFQAGPFVFDALICTHPDYDHYGGFLDMTRHVRKQNFRYEAVYHCGLGRFTGKATKYQEGRGHSQLGPVHGGTLPDAYVTALLDGFDDVAKYKSHAGSRNWKLVGSYGQWLSDLYDLHPSGVGNLCRVDNKIGYLPGFTPRESSASVKVLGPVVEKWQGKPALRYLDSAGVNSMTGPSKTRNGHSIILRINYDKVRILLTGDLNFRSQALLLDHIKKDEFKCHVAKACHHGSEDISWTFLQAMSPLATMFSSGDNESYTHPRAKILGLSGAFGKPVRRGRKKRFLGLEEDRYVAPLIYSTELSRSIELFEPYAAYDESGNKIPKAELQAKGRTDPSKGPRDKLENWLLGDRMVYGLINVRTDGKRILMAVLKEDSSSFQVEVLNT